eukprot:TRINITY_DN6321_c0_g1_i4.p1 TRINITY_DN6321_c0_g1~~TRINITY_DN6321_c0_g1_i4.p1  ORF type:complete len:311 (-),score=24.86 TRINITY_DN6321_c0_g1_i4:264-1196(-)
MAHQPRQVTFGETEKSEFMLPKKKKDRNSNNVGVGHDFWQNFESSERRKVRRLPTKTHVLLALGRAVELRAAVEEYMLEPVPVSHQAVAPELLVQQPPAVARVRRPAPPARHRSRSESSQGGREIPAAVITAATILRPSRDCSSSAGSASIPQTQSAKSRRSLDDHDTRVLPLLGVRPHGSPLSDSEGDEDETENEAPPASTSQASCGTPLASHAGIVTAQASSMTDGGTGVPAFVPLQLTRRLVRAVTIADPTHAALNREATDELPLRPVLPSSSIERPRPAFPYHRRSFRSQTLPDMSSNREQELERS